MSVVLRTMTDGIWSMTCLGAVKLLKQFMGFRSVAAPDWKSGVNEMDGIRMVDFALLPISSHW